MIAETLANSGFLQSAVNWKMVGLPVNEPKRRRPLACLGSQNRRRYRPIIPRRPTGQRGSLAWGMRTAGIETAGRPSSDQNRRRAPSNGGRGDRTQTAAGGVPVAVSIACSDELGVSVRPLWYCAPWTCGPVYVPACSPTYSNHPARLAFGCAAPAT